MKRVLVAAALAASFGSTGVAQPPAPIPPPPVLAAPVAGPIPRHAQGFYKSGGILVGADGYFPYDSGQYLLGGTDGLARTTGYFTMVPGPPAFYAGRDLIEPEPGYFATDYAARRCRFRK